MNARLSLGSGLTFVYALALAATAHATPATGMRGAAATAHPAASRAAQAMLQAGGNAIDAAVAAAFVLAVVEPYSSGIGGGGFAMVKVGEALEFHDFREVAPKAATRDMYMKNGKPDPGLARDGILSVGVPGAVAGYLGLHERHGSLPRAQVLDAAIVAAEQGFIVDPNYLADTEWRLDVLRNDPEAARIFLVAKKSGEASSLPFLGHRIVQPELAATLRILAAQGPRAFYEGEVAKRLVLDMRTRGGLITAEDLAAYRVRQREPLVGSYRGLAVASSPPPSSGGQIVLTVLNALESLPTPRPWHDPRELHLMIEAMKRAFADRTLLGDPTFVSDPTRLLTAKDRMPKLLRLMGQRAARAAHVPPGQATQLEPKKGKRRMTGASPESPSTTHLSVVDIGGNAVAMTTTVNYGFGSGIVARGTGVLWNDQMDDFAIAPGVPNAYGIAGSEANAVAPGKVPLSSMAPTFVFAGPTTQAPLRLVVGSPGGPRIPTTVIQVIVNHLDHGADIEQAIALGRVHHQHLPDVVAIEGRALDQLTRRELERRGHVFEVQPTWSNATAIAIDPQTGTRTAAADPRGVGLALVE